MTGEPPGGRQRLAGGGSPAGETPAATWGLATVALVAVALALHVEFCLVDSRPAVDLGHYYAGAEAAIRAAGERGGVDWRQAGSPYGALIAATWAVVGRSQAALEAWDGLWLAALVAGLALAGRAVGGTRGLVVAGAAGIVFPVFPTSARTHWIHHPEGGLAALALGLASTAPTSAGWGAVLGLVGAVGATVRPSAGFWLVVPMVVWVVRAGVGRWQAWAPAVGLFALGEATLIPAVPGYLAMRVHNRAATSAAVGSPWPLLPIATGALPGAVYALLSGAGTQKRDPTVLAAGVWLLVGLAVVAYTGAGPDNVPTVFVGLAVLAAAGAPRVPDRLVPGFALLALGPLTQLAPPLGALMPLTGWTSDDHALNWLVPRSDGTSARAIVAALDATCPPRSTSAGHRRVCRVVVQRGLVHPSWEDDGSLALFLAGVDDVDVVAAPMWNGQTHVDVAVAVACEGANPDPTARFPGVDERFQAVLGEPVTTVRGNGCEWTWTKARP